MAIWKPERFVITEKGDELLSRVIAGEGSLHISRIVTGGDFADVDILKSQTEVKQIKQECRIISVETTNEGSKILVRLNNIGLSQSYTLYQLGVYAGIDGSGEEVLYMLAQCEFFGADNIPAETEAPYEVTYSLYIKHSGTSNITFSINDDIEKLREEIAEQSIVTLNSAKSYTDEKVAGVNKDINSLKGDISRLDGEVTSLKLMYATNITSNPFSVTFETLDGLTVSGTHNTTQNSIDF